MDKVFKALSLPLLLIIVICLLINTGCQPPVSQEETTRILTKSLDLLENANSYKSNLDIQTDLTVSGGSEEGAMSHRMVLDAVINVADSKSQLDFRVITGINTPEVKDTDEMEIETYLFEDTIYTKLPHPDLGLVWYKSPVSESSIDTYDIDIVDQQIVPLHSPKKVKSLRNETLDGVQCLVLEVVPENVNLIDWINELKVTDLTVDQNDLEVLEDIVKNPIFTLWVAEATNYMKKLTGEVRLEISPEDFGVSEEFFNNLDIDVALSFEVYDYNHSEVIILPGDALDAKELAF